MMSHPNIVSVYDVSHSENIDYIVMELIEGISLKQYMERKGPLNWRETLHFSMQIAKALEHAHGRGIVHRDIKPHNILILKDGSIKVTDFGIARIGAAQNTLTRVHADDVGMRKHRNGLRFGLEPTAELLIARKLLLEDLDGDGGLFE